MEKAQWGAGFGRSVGVGVLLALPAHAICCAQAHNSFELRFLGV